MNKDNLIKEAKKEWSKKYTNIIDKITDNVDVGKYIVVDIDRDVVKFDVNSYVNEVKNQISKNVKDTKIEVLVKVN